MQCTEVQIGRCYDVLLDYGEDINQALKDLVQKEGIDTAVITSGLGGFDKFTLHYSAAPSQHWSDCVLQLASVQGMIINGSPQVHAAVTLDGRDGITRVGRCGDNCTRLFYCELMVQELLSR